MELSYLFLSQYVTANVSFYNSYLHNIATYQSVIESNWNPWWPAMAINYHCSIDFKLIRYESCVMVYCILDVLLLSKVQRKVIFTYSWNRIYSIYQFAFIRLNLYYRNAVPLNILCII